MKHSRRDNAAVDLRGIEIVSEAEAETADFVVCAPKGSWTPFTDNLEGLCMLCGIAVIFRPHAPKKPPKICLACMIARDAATLQ